MAQFSVSILLLVLGITMMMGSYIYMTTQIQTENLIKNLTQLDKSFTTHFKNWLNSNGYSNYKFDRPDLVGGCYGGYEINPVGKPARNPIIFIHGNSDIGVGEAQKAAWQTGFTSLVQFLIANGYVKSDLYVTTWGLADPLMASQTAHTAAYTQTVRAFIEAVLKYTNADQVNIVAHSMGVTLSRKAVKGGTGKDGFQTYDLGPALTNKVKNFFSLAGANLGLKDCQYTTGLPTCGKDTGFYPGLLTSAPSTYLTEINSNSAKEGLNVYSLWSPADDLIKYNCIVFSKNTCIIPGTQDISYDGYNHFDVRDKTGVDILKLIKTNS